MQSTLRSFDLAHLAHVELLTPKPDESLRFFVDVMGMTESGRAGQSVYLRAWDDYEHHTLKLTEAETARLFEATRATLLGWVDRISAQAAGGFPEGVTAFREGMAVHGRYGKPCPVCGSPVQRIAYADNETNYCATCQTGGRLLADRALSRLLKQDWPRTLEELERVQAGRRGVSARSTSANEGAGPSL